MSIMAVAIAMIANNHSLIVIITMTTALVPRPEGVESRCPVDKRLCRLRPEELEALVKKVQGLTH